MNHQPDQIEPKPRHASPIHPCLHLRATCQFVSNYKLAAAAMGKISGNEGAKGDGMQAGSGNCAVSWPPQPQFFPATFG